MNEPITIERDERGADSVQRLFRRIEELEGCLRTIERRLREETAPILTLVRAFGGEETKKAWKKAIYASAVRAQVILHSPNNQAEPLPPDGECGRH